MMLGYTQQNNDVYIFFENDEIERLEEGKIQGIFVNFRNPKVIGLLEALIDNKIPDRIKTPTTKDNEDYIIQMILLLRTEVYNALKERRTFELHEGFRHVCLRDANNLDFSDVTNYRQCKHYRAQHSQLET